MGSALAPEDDKGPSPARVRPLAHLALRCRPAGNHAPSCLIISSSSSESSFHSVGSGFGSCAVSWVGCGWLGFCLNMREPTVWPPVPMMLPMTSKAGQICKSEKGLGLLQNCCRCTERLTCLRSHGVHVIRRWRPCVPTLVAQQRRMPLFFVFSRPGLP